MDQIRAELITLNYGQGKLHHAARQLPYYADLLPSLVIHETRPARTRPDALYVTNGLSTPNADQPLGMGFELQMIAPAGASWPVTLLVSLAAHARRTDNHFVAGQSISLTRTLTDADDTLSALIFTRAPGLPTVLRLPDGEVRLLTVVGVTSDEHDWARRYSANELVALLQLCGQGVATLPGRRSVVPGVGTGSPRARRLA